MCIAQPNHSPRGTELPEGLEGLCVALHPLTRRNACTGSPRGEPSRERPRHTHLRRFALQRSCLRLRVTCSATHGCEVGGVSVGWVTSPQHQTTQVRRKSRPHRCARHQASTYTTEYSIQQQWGSVYGEETFTSPKRTRRIQSADLPLLNVLLPRRLPMGASTLTMKLVGPRPLLPTTQLPVLELCDMLRLQQA